MNNKQVADMMMDAESHGFQFERSESDRGYTDWLFKSDRGSLRFLGTCNEWCYSAASRCEGVDDADVSNGYAVINATGRHKEIDGAIEIAKQRVLSAIESLQCV
jgi:hypothetical protein